MERDAKHASVPLHRVRAGEHRLGGHFYELKAGPAATRLLDETPGNVVAVRLGSPERHTPPGRKKRQVQPVGGPWSRHAVPSAKQKIPIGRSQRSDREDWVD